MPTTQGDEEVDKLNPNTNRGVLNPGNRFYEDKFKTKKNNADPTGRVDSHGDVINRNYNADPDDSRKDIEQQERSGDSLYKSSDSRNKSNSRFNGNLRVLANRFGPTGGIIGLLLFSIVGLGGGSGTLASSLLVNIKEIFHNDRSDATRTNRIFSRATIANAFNGQKNCTGSKIKCKISTMSKSMVKNLKEQGYRIKGVLFSADGKGAGSYDSANDNELNKDKSPPNNNSPGKGMSDSETLGVTEIDTPKATGGGTVRSGRGLFASVDSSVEGTRLFNRAFNSRSAFYLNKFFNDSILGGKFGFSKASQKFPEDGKDQKSQEEAKKAQDKQFNEDSGGLSNADKNGPELQKRAAETAGKAEKASGIDKQASKSSKGGLVGSAVQGICATYRLTRGAIVAVKAYQILQLSKFALVFLQAADEIKAGDGEQSRVNYLSNNLTSYENNPKMSQDTLYAKKGDSNPKYNLSATDSQGYRVAAHGDTSALQDFAKAYLLGGNGTVKKINNILTDIEDKVGVIPGISGASNSAKGRAVIKNACRAANGNLVNALLACVGVGTAITGLSEAVAGAETLGLSGLVGAGITVDLCACTASISIQNSFLKELPKSISDFAKSIGKYTDPCRKQEEAIKQATSFAISLVKNYVLKDYIVDILKEVSVGSDTKGVDAGNAIAAGVGLMLSTTASGYGLKPSVKDDNNKEVTDYIAYTQPLEDKYIALEKDNARLHPFDPSNQYSVIGSLVRAFNPASTISLSGSLLGDILTVGNLIPSAFQIGLTGQSASALYNQPSTAANGAGGRYDCQDDDLAYINATGDKFCSIVGVSSVDELKIATDQAYNPSSTAFSKLVDYMTNKQVGTDGTKDPNDCALIDGSDDKSGCPSSELPSIDDNGAPVVNSQYDKYLHYCTDQREQPWGSQSEPYEQGSERDQDWYSGVECTKNSTMLKNFRMWTNVCLQIGTMNGSLNCYSASAAATPTSTGCGGSLDGDARVLAQKILSCPNIRFQIPSEKTAMEYIAQTGRAIECGAPAIDTTILKYLLYGAGKYKLTVGVLVDGHGCDGGPHQTGQAVDINGIAPMDQGFEQMLNWTADDQKNIAEFEKYISGYAQPGRLEFGQKQCWSSIPIPLIQGQKGNGQLNDTCNHLHMDATNFWNGGGVVSVL